MTKAKEIRDKSIEELDVLLRDKRLELFELRNAAARTKNMESSHLIRLGRKDIARFETIKREKELAKYEES